MRQVLSSSQVKGIPSFLTVFHGGPETQVPNLLGDEGSISKYYQVLT